MCVKARLHDVAVYDVSARSLFKINYILYIVSIMCKDPSTLCFFLYKIAVFCYLFWTIIKCQSKMSVYDLNFVKSNC